MLASLDSSAAAARHLPCGTPLVAHARRGYMWRRRDERKRCLSPFIRAEEAMRPCRSASSCRGNSAWETVTWRGAANQRAPWLSERGWHSSWWIRAAFSVRQKGSYKGLRRVLYFFFCLFLNNLDKRAAPYPSKTQLENSIYPESRRFVKTIVGGCRVGIYPVLQKHMNEAKANNS